MAARGLDIPRVDWIVQFDPPDDPRDYIHRVGRTARAGKVGKSLLFLLESELGFLRFLKEAKIPLNEFTFPADRIANVQSQVRLLKTKLETAGTKDLLVGKVTAEELLFASIRERWLSSVSPSICILLSQKNIRREQA